MRLVESVRGSALATLMIFGLAECGESPLAPVPDAPAQSPDGSVWGGCGSFADVLGGGNW